MMQNMLWLPALVFFGILFSLCALIFVFRTMKKSPARDRRLLASLIGSLAIIAIAFIAHLIASRFMGLSGEPLQIPLLFAIVASGIGVGFWIGSFTKRVGFVESLWVTTSFSLMPVFLSGSLDSMFTYATSPAYFGALFLATYLLLLLSLTFGGSIGFLFCGDGRLSYSFGYENWIGRRFLMAKRSSGAISIITLISTIAVMMGCAGMIVVMSVMNGFSSDLRSKILGANAHVLLLKFGSDFSEYPELIKKTEDISGVVGKSPFILYEVMISSDSNLSGAVIKGIDPATVGSVSLLRENLIEGSIDHLATPKDIPISSRQIPKSGDKNEDATTSEHDRLADAIERASVDDDEDEDDNPEPVLLPGVIIGKEMAYSLRAGVGDIVNVVSPIGELGPTGPTPKAKPFRVAGIFFSGMFEYDSKFVYISVESAQDFFGMGTSVTGIEFKLDNIEKTQSAARAIYDAVGGHPYYTKDWMQMNRNLFSALKLEKIAMFIILLALIFMASLLILVALIMVVIEKGKEIAILKSMGATDTSVMKIFVTYGLFIGGIGSVLGLILGIGLCSLIQVFGIGLDAEVYYITRIPVLIDPIEVLTVGLGAIIISFFATIPPSLFAARLKPVEGLRYE